MGSDSGGSWSYSPKQATVPFSSCLCCLLMAGMNIPLHLQKWENAGASGRRYLLDFQPPLLLCQPPNPDLGSQYSRMAEMTSLHGANVQIRVIFFSVQLASVFSDKWGCCHLGGRGEKTVLDLGLLYTPPSPLPSSVFQVPGSVKQAAWSPGAGGLFSPSIDKASLVGRGKGFCRRGGGDGGEGESRSLAPGKGSRWPNKISLPTLAQLPGPAF